MNISVIIPTFDRKELIKRALDSVIAQTYQPHEIIVVDDGSSDGTYALREEYKDVIFLRQENKGVSAARNNGVANACGEWICFLDSDDTWTRRKLERQKAFHEEHPDIQISQTDEIWIRNGRRVNPMKKHKKYGGDIFVRSLPLCLITPSSVMMRRTLFDEIGCFDETFQVCEDYDLWLRVTARYPVGLIQENLIVKYGGHADQLSRTLYGMDRFRITALEGIADSPLLDQNKKRELLKELARKCIIYAKGSLKRNKADEAQIYFSKATLYSENREGLL